MSDLIYNIREIFDDESPKGCLQQHGCRAYRIPPYQRGYKWGSETNEPVGKLWKDLRQAWIRNDKEYLLQAISVKKITDDQSESVLEVIDGQQRLTTLFILIYALNFRTVNPVCRNIAEHKLQYSIRHQKSNLDELITQWIESVVESAQDYHQFLEIHKVENETHQDNYYLKCATLRCVHELEIHSENRDFKTNQDWINFQNFLFDRVKLMVNTVESNVSGEIMFGNLNSNRVELTEIELIKGLLLTRVAREPSESKPRQYREVLEMRIQLGQKWDEFNHWANLPEIRTLYFPAFEEGMGMQGLLELVARQMTVPFTPTKSTKKGEKSLFEFFFSQHHLKDVFSLLTNTYSRLQDWFENYHYYHLIGYCLIHEKAADRLPFLVKQLNCNTKPKLNEGLLGRRKTILFGRDEARGDEDNSTPVSFGTLRYGEQDERIKSILLALSVFQKESTGRFNFLAFARENWSLEHIFPQTPFGKGAELSAEQQIVALNILLNHGQNVLNEQITDKITQLRDATGELNLKVEVENLLKSEPILHKIGNLCLLSSKDNSAMGCGMFNEKRKVIRDLIDRGNFVPRHTYEIFSKMIVSDGDGDSLDSWSDIDIEKHESVIEKRICELMEEKS